ncbi:PP2C family protein-serine/threonine phosphatase [Kitasatospora sp. NPDC059571]|uniref:PP2C family protein-serine/threonine phosphatase n=1 Tax=Kitasatospora sp. NPDC059571 TaxID=3346871 RepID=UPI00368F4183
MPSTDPDRGTRPSRALLLLPLGLIAAVCVVDVLAPPSIHLGPLLVAAPAITAAFAGPRMTAAIGALAVGAQVFIGAARGVLGTENLEAQITALVLVSALITLFRLIRDRHEHQLTRTRSVAQAAQQVLIQPLPDHSGPLGIASLYIAAEQGTEIGGDLFSAARTHHSTRLLIGDVRGKGLAAINHAALLAGAFRAAAHRRATLPNLAVHLDGAVRWDTAQWRTDTADSDGGSVDETFATATLLDIPDRDPVLHTVNCGHPPPLLLRDGRVTPLDPREPALPLGLGTLAGPADYSTDTFAFEEGDLLLLYTDGVIEARDAEGTFYPLAERAASWTRQSPQELLRRLHDDLLVHTGGHLGDDAAVIAVRRGPGATPG